MRLNETMPHDAARSAMVLRPQPTLSWTDRGGDHKVTIGDRAVLGAAPNVDVPIAEPTVSRLHAELALRDQALWVRDLGSRNGTFVDGVRVESACLREGGRLRLGAVEVQVSYARKPVAIELWPDGRFGPLVGGSVPMRQLYARLAKAAPTDSTVLLHGETGTGKELVARAIHDASARATGPFVVVDCAALPENLLESELFGHAKGAFTGATVPRAGALESAEGGTVFLDEVGELPLPLQPKLLRILETRSVRRLGENHQRAVDVRFVSATHRDLRAMVNERSFREDLFFRLAVLPVVVPPLRERLDDVAALARHFLRGEADALLTPELLRELEGRPWTGNVRELRNVLERVRAFGAAEALVTTAAGSPPTQTTDAAAGPMLTPDLFARPYAEVRERCIERFEREYVAGLLRLHGGNVSAAAEAAGLNRTYLHRLMRRHGL